MGLIFFLSSLPAKSFPIGTTNFEENLAHIFLYAVLGYLIYQGVINFGQKTVVWKLMLLSLGLVALYGISDEYHQGFVPGRFVSFSDLGFDIFGGSIGIILADFMRKRKPKLLLHICCVGCGAYVSRLLKQNYRVKLYFYNPNIYPESEYEKRFNEARSIARKFQIPLLAEKYDHLKWLELVKGLEREPERGRRCSRCFSDRLSKTALKAKAMKIKHFATTLTVSPHKDALAINDIGRKLAREFRLTFIDEDFKKLDGFSKSCQLAKELDLYRQDYCGCEFNNIKNKT